jgi:uncharacterized protein YjbI with pentapeptide repeats
MKSNFFRGKNICGRSWKKADLSEGVFVECRSGLPLIQVANKVISLSVLSGFTGILAALSALFSTGLLGAKSSLHDILLGVSIATLTLVGLVITFRRGFSTFLVLSLATFVASGILILILRTSSIIDAFIYIPITITSEVIALWLGSITVAASRTLSKEILVSTGISAFLGIGFILLFVKQLSGTVNPNLIDIAIAMGILSSASLIGFNALDPTSRFPGIARLAINLTSTGGTSFQQANLTEADFSRASLKHTDFRDANLTRTRWYSAKGLEFARLGNTYLANPKIRQLVVTCNGQGQNFDGLDLTGVNLQGANLQDASFIGANLNQSNLRDADLSRAILKQTQLDDADLTGAILTAACIEDWGMTSTTKLENVQCDYVYMRLPTPEKRNPLRKPDDERKTFSEGEFADFIKPYFDTLDLYHRQDVDPRSISIALKNLAENHPDAELQFVALEWRGNGLNIRYTTAPDVDKSELSHKYFTNYARIRKELLGSIQLRLAAQDAEINRMEGVINKFIQTGTHQSTIQAETIQVIQGELVVTENRGININAGDNASISGLSSGDGIVNLGTISGNVTNAINQLPDSHEPDQLSLKTLLAQLQQVIETDGDLPDPDKADLLEQVQSLAEAKQVEEPAKREGIARKAMKMFDATLKSLPDTAKIVDACSKLLPLILKALGFPA